MGNDKNLEQKNVEDVSQAKSDEDMCLPTICKTIGGTIYVTKMHFNNTSKMNIDDKLLRLMCEDFLQNDS